MQRQLSFTLKGVLLDLISQHLCDAEEYIAEEVLVMAFKGVKIPKDRDVISGRAFVQESF